MVVGFELASRLAVLGALLLATPMVAHAQEPPEPEGDDIELPEVGEVEPMPAGDPAAASEPAAGAPVPDPPPVPATDTAGDRSLLRGLKAARLSRARKTSIGGYAELHASHVRPDSADAESEVDLRRLVLFVAHNFTDRMRFYSELELEHASVGEGEPGDLDIAQAYVEWDLLADKWLSLRAGVVLVPMGIVNEHHEPSNFNSVQRPMVEQLVIPSTWSEAAVGFTGQPFEGLRWEAYLVSGLDPTGFSAASGLAGGRQSVAEARTDGPAVTGRVEWEPIVSTIIGASGYAGFAGPNAELFAPTGEELDPLIPVLGGALDARTRYLGIEARGLFASWQIGDTGELRGAFGPDGTIVGPDAGSTILGGYAEVGYDVLDRLPSAQQVVPFFRFERYDTLFRVRERARMETDEPFGVSDYVLGVSYRPISDVVFKGDATLRNPDGSDNHAFVFQAGVGLMY